MAGEIQITQNVRCPACNWLVYYIAGPRAGGSPYVHCTNTDCAREIREVVGQEVPYELDGEVTG